MVSHKLSRTSTATSSLFPSMSNVIRRVFMGEAATDVACGSAVSVEGKLAPVTTPIATAELFARTRKSRRVIPVALGLLFLSSVMKSLRDQEFCEFYAAAVRRVNFVKAVSNLLMLGLHPRLACLPRRKPWGREFIQFPVSPDQRAVQEVMPSFPVSKRVFESVLPNN